MANYEKSMIEVICLWITQRETDWRCLRTTRRL